MWDKKIDSPLQSKIPETFFNSLLNGKSDPLGNFLKTSLLDRVICQITQEWSLQKLFSKCNTALQWDFFPGFGELKELYVCHTSVLLSFKQNGLQIPLLRAARFVLAFKYQTLLRKIRAVPWVFDYRLPAGCVGCGRPWGDTHSSPRGAKQAGSDGNGWSSQQGKASNTAQLLPQWAQFPWWGQQATSIPQELISAELCCSSSQI